MPAINSKLIKIFSIYIQGCLLSPGKMWCLWLKTTPMMMAVSPVGQTPSVESPLWSCSPPKTQVHCIPLCLLFSENG